MLTACTLSYNSSTSTTVKTNSTVCLVVVPAASGFLAHKQKAYRPLTKVTLSAKSKTLRSGDTVLSPTPHPPVRCQSDGVSMYTVAALPGPESSVHFVLTFRG
ncbi:hypothetical protein ElyMa_002354200 [Elysia marginata]|uniref:Uncharacterized protein n=1 Tax=Elysia marginata TaxID=1093978 RepID=A0AAV4G859_9GAST|nr:hypothetical protein ElyMa_002354200 [Elysia marginata]